MPYCNECNVTHCEHNLSKRKKPRNGHTYRYEHWGCPDNYIGKFSKNYHGELYEPTTQQDLPNF